MPDPILLDLSDTLATERLTLRPPRAGDGGAVYDAVMETLLPLRRFPLSMPWVMGEYTKEVAEAWCRQSAARFLLRTEFTFLLFLTESKQLVGAMGGYAPEWSTPACEIGFWCRASRMGEGLMTEALSRLVQFLRDELGMVRLEIRTDQ